MSLGEHIALERKKQGFSQEEIAALIGVSRQAVSKWEKGSSSPSTENMIRLSEILGISLEQLTGCSPPEGSTDGHRKRILYKVSDTRFKKLLIKEKIRIRLMNPFLFFLYLEAWETLYRLAYIGMLRKNGLLFLFYAAVISLFLIEGVTAIVISAKRQVIHDGDFLEFTEECVMITDKLYRKKLQIPVKEVRRIVKDRKYYFLLLEGQRFLPVSAEDIDKEDEEMLRRYKKWRWKWQYYAVSVTLWICITVCGTFAVGQCAVNLGGSLSWKLEELKSEKKIRLKETNFYKTGLKGIMKEAETKTDFMPHLMTDNVDIVFAADGEIESIEASIYGYDNDYKLRVGYFIYYDAGKDQKMTLYIEDCTKRSGYESREYDLDNDMEILFHMEEHIDVREVIEEKNWDEERYGFYYKGIASWGFGGYEDGIRFINKEGTVEYAPWYPKEEIAGPSLSIYCPDRLGEEEGPVPARYVYVKG